MKAVSYLKGAVLGLACVGMVIPAPVFAQSSAPSQTAHKAAVADIALTGGTLQGVVVDPNGDVLSGAVVSVSHGNQKVATAISSESGEFSLNGLQSGLYQVTVGQHQANVRIWDAELAPPGTNSQMLLVNGDPTARGQLWNNWFRNLRPWHTVVIAGVIATAIAVPIAIHNSNNNNDDPIIPITP